MTTTDACKAINALMPTPRQLEDFSMLHDDGPIVMVNLLKFKADGGAAEYMKYARGIEPILRKIGARLLFAGRGEFCLIGAAEWDQVALVQYPNKKALLDMTRLPEYEAIHVHREAGLEGQVNYCVRQVV
jgi:uncharacterized protein (DUF1330 family)